MLGLVGPSIGVATNAGKVISFLSSLKEISEEGELLWLALDSIEGPLELARALRKRQRFAGLFDGAVRLTLGTIEACERVLARDDGEDGRPGSREGWSRWLQHKKEGIARRDALPKLTSRLNLCMNSLQLAFSAMSSLHPPLLAGSGSATASSAGPAHGGLRQPFVLMKESVLQARDLVHEFEMGRRSRLLLCTGCLHTRSAAASRADTLDWRAREQHTLWLEQSGDGDAFSLRFRRAPVTVGLTDADDDNSEGRSDAEVDPEGGSEDLQRRPASSMPVRVAAQLKTGAFQLRREWSGDVRGLELAEHRVPYSADQPTYLLDFVAPRGSSCSGCAIVFEVPSMSASEDERGVRDDGGRPLTAEVFDAILTMFLLKCTESGDVLDLHRVCDLESDTGRRSFLDSMRRLVGPYEAGEVDAAWQT